MECVLLANTDVSQNTVYRGMSHFPGRIVKILGDRSPALLSIAGSVELMSLVDAGQRRSVGLAASVDTPAKVFEETDRLVRALANAGARFVGGFLSPAERLQQSASERNL